MNKFKQYKITVKEESLDESTIKNASQLKYDKDGIGMQYDVLGKNITVICDRDLPTTFILARIAELLEKKEKDIEDRM